MGLTAPYPYRRDPLRWYYLRETYKENAKFMTLRL